MLQAKLRLCKVFFTTVLVMASWSLENAMWQTIVSCFASMLLFFYPLMTMFLMYKHYGRLQKDENLLLQFQPLY